MLFFFTLCFRTRIERATITATSKRKAKESPIHFMARIYMCTYMFVNACVCVCRYYFRIIKWAVTKQYARALWARTLVCSFGSHLKKTRSRVRFNYLQGASCESFGRPAGCVSVFRERYIYLLEGYSPEIRFRG